MKKRTLISTILILIISISFISSFDASSSSYSVDSFNIGLAGGNLSSSSYDSKFSSQYQQSVVDGESSSYSSTIGWFYTSFCGDGTCDSDETCSSCPSDCGECSAPEIPITPSAGGGGGCTYDWVCSEWYPEPCPSEGFQKRVCVNRGSCNGISGMPDLEKNCIPSFVSPAEPLFDIFLRVPLFKKWISKGDSIDTDVELVNVGNTTKIDVFFKYWIVDKNNRLILEKQETRAVGEYEKFTIRFPLSRDLKTGVYKIYAHISYDDGKVALAGDSFEIFQSRFVMIIRVVLISLGILLGIIGLIFLITKIFRRKISIKKEKPKKIVRIKYKRIETKRVSIFDFFAKLRERMHKARMKRMEFQEKLRRIRQQRESRRGIFIKNQERLQRMKEARERALEERERRLSEQRIARRRTLEENKRMEERLREERRRAYRERRIIQEREEMRLLEERNTRRMKLKKEREIMHRKPERKKKIKLFNFNKKKKIHKKKKKKFIHLTLTRGGHEERVRLEE